MERKKIFLIMLAFVVAVFTLGCGSEKPVDVKAVMSQPKTFVGSETCRGCHLEHYDSWKMTLHSRMLIDVSKNPNAFVVEWNKDTIRTDLEKIKAKLKVPLEEVYIPEKSEVLYVIGTQWKQRYVLKKGDMFVVAPVQYNVASKRWVNYYDDAWDKRDWLVRCGGCHATGVDLKAYTFKEKSIGCEACHGAGSRHAALPRKIGRAHV